MVGEIRGRRSQEYEFRTVNTKLYLIHRQLFWNIILMQVGEKGQSQGLWVGMVIRAMCMPCTCRECYGRERVEVQGPEQSPVC